MSSVVVSQVIQLWWFFRSIAMYQTRHDVIQKLLHDGTATTSSSNSGSHEHNSMVRQKQWNDSRQFVQVGTYVPYTNVFLPVSSVQPNNATCRRCQDDVNVKWQQWERICSAHYSLTFVFGQNCSVKARQFGLPVTPTTPTRISPTAALL